MAANTDDEKKIEFLLNFTNYSCDYLPEKLKTHFSNLSILTANSFRKALPNALTDSQYVCQYCLTQFNDDNCRVKILPMIKPGPAMRRILNKVKKHKQLSDVEKKLAMRVHTGNRLVIKCNMCLRKTVKKYSKPEKQVVVVMNEPVETPKLVSKKKKKKKRKTPILDLSVLSANNSPQLEIIDLTEGSSPNRTSLSTGFVPLVASTPFTKKQNNPLSLKTKPANAKQKNKRSSLKKLLEEESPRSQSTVKSLKDFLSRVNP